MTPSLQRLQTSLQDRYRVERELGSGGMATVYVAEDLRHERKVAVKVLKPELSAILGAERFLNEIRVTAHLQHPHILPLYDSGSAEGLLYYVMPYIEGESLRDRLAREKQLPIEEAIEITRAVASALDYAHRHNVVHRDIKPENILVHEGQALVADFGIALAVSAAGGHRLTETGLSLGTPHYMSPEQATGDRQLDGRSDIYSLGCVAYEMLAGDPPHTGSTAQAIIAKIVTETPSRLSLARPSVPPQVEAAIHKALEKLPADRFATAGQFAEALVKPSTVPATVGAPSVTRPIVGAALATRLLGSWRVPVLVIVALGAGVVAGRDTVRAPASPGAVARFFVPIGPDHRLTSAPVQTIALSPDGTTLAYAGVSARGGQLYLRRMASLTPTPIPGTERATDPFFSPDGAWLGFLVSGQIKKVPVSGGAPVVVAEGVGLGGVTWGDNGTIVFKGSGPELLQVPEGGGAPQRVAAPDSTSGERSLSFPDVLPGGKAVLFAAQRTVTSGGTGIAVVSLETGKRKVLIPSGAIVARYASSGHLIYALTDGTLQAVPFDLGRLEISGTPTTIADHVRITARDVAQFTVSRSGSLAYVPEQPAELALVDRRGASQLLTALKRNFHHPRFSPDGRRVVLDITHQGSRDVWVEDLEQGTLSRVSFERDANDPVWSPDGGRVCYATAKSGTRGVYCKNADGSGAAESLSVMGNEQTAGVWTPDGQQLILNVSGPSSFDLWALTVAGDRKLQPLLASPFNEGWPALPPDGRWLAYVSDESGQSEVYVRPFPGPGGRVQISPDGGSEPAWARSGREVFYWRPGANGSQIMAVGVQTAPAFRIVSRTPLFAADDFESAAPHANYDVAPGGKSFVMVRHAQAWELILVQNWAAELRGAKQ